jgi:hypothetical protein
MIWRSTWTWARHSGQLDGAKCKSVNACMHPRSWRAASWDCLRYQTKCNMCLDCSYFWHSCAFDWHLWLGVEFLCYYMIIIDVWQAVCVRNLDADEEKLILHRRFWVSALINIPVIPKLLTEVKRCRFSFRPKDQNFHLHLVEIQVGYKSEFPNWISLASGTSRGQRGSSASMALCMRAQLHIDRSIYCHCRVIICEDYNHSHSPAEFDAHFLTTANHDFAGACCLYSREHI